MNAFPKTIVSGFLGTISLRSDENHSSDSSSVDGIDSESISKPPALDTKLRHTAARSVSKTGASDSGVDRCVYQTFQATETTSLECVQTTARMLAHNITRYFVTKATNPSPAHNSHAKTLRRTADQLSEKHGILFTSMVKKLRVEELKTCCESFVSVANEMLSDEEVNWGRIVALYTFAGWFAKHCAEGGREEDWVGAIAGTAGDYVAERLGPWILNQGGWDEMDRFFVEEENVESKIWRGLFYTMLGLGALATTVATVR